MRKSQSRRQGRKQDKKRSGYKKKMDKEVTMTTKMRRRRNRRTKERRNMTRWNKSHRIARLFSKKRCIGPRTDAKRTLTWTRRHTYSSAKTDTVQA